jgi:hypothetical protein
MDGALKKGVGLLLILFLGFWLVQDPNGLAHSFENAGSAIWDVLSTLFTSLREFFKSLSN